MAFHISSEPIHTQYFKSTDAYELKNSDFGPLESMTKIELH